MESARAADPKTKAPDRASRPRSKRQSKPANGRPASCQAAIGAVTATALADARAASVMNRKRDPNAPGSLQSGRGAANISAAVAANESCAPGSNKAPGSTPRTAIAAAASGSARRLERPRTTTSASTRRNTNARRTGIAQPEKSA